MIETFTDNPAERWRFIIDRVMGGVSSGQLQFDSDTDRCWARMTETVSTANNGGFIQMQARFGTPCVIGSGGVRLAARGNQQRYFVHLRRTGVLSPTAFYRAAFDVAADWSDIILPFRLFVGANECMPVLASDDILASIAVVAFGTDYNPDISVSTIGLY